MEIQDRKKKLRDWDVLFSLILIAANLWLIRYGLSISRAAMKVTRCEFYLAPGLMPMVIGITMLGLAVSLLMTALRQGGNLAWLMPARLKEIFVSNQFRQTVIVFAYLFIYIFILWERVPYLGIKVPFWAATFIFLNLMMITFRAARLLQIVVISGITTVVVDYSFRVLARVPLP